jgi:hypothetical protein
MEPDAAEPDSEVLFTGLLDLSLPKDQLESVFVEPDDLHEGPSTRLVDNDPGIPMGIDCD